MIVAIVGASVQTAYLAGAARSAGDRIADDGPLADVGAGVEFVVTTAGGADALTDIEQVVAPTCVIAVLTSSVSPALPIAVLDRPERFVGLHVVGAPPHERLVEIVRYPGTALAAVESVAASLTRWGLRTVPVAAAPGLVVDRVTRPFYSEAWRLYDQRAADSATIDAVLVGCGGFRRGPFEVMDDVGQDVDEALGRALWTALDYDPRFAPSPVQRTLVETGHRRRPERNRYRDDGDAAAAVAPPRTPPLEVVAHGTSSLHHLLKRGFVAVLGGDPDGDSVELPAGAVMLPCSGPTATELAAELGRPVVLVDAALDYDNATAVAITACDLCPDTVLSDAIGLLQDARLDVYVVDDVPGMIVARTVAMLVNHAVDALHHGIASAAEIDTALRLGADFPIGPFAWGERWGARQVLGVLDNLLRIDGDPRYRAAPLLRRRALSGVDLAVSPDRAVPPVRG